MGKENRLPAPDHLTIRLFAPGMSALHRAGLAGLACTLKVMEYLYRNGRLTEAKLPAPFNNDQPPWRIESQSITLMFSKPENAGEYLKNLFAFAFQLKNGIIYLPGQYGDVTPSIAVLAAIQEGIQNTFLQHGPTCGSREGDRTAWVEINDAAMPIQYDVFTSYKHQGWFWLDRDEKSKTKDPNTGKKLKTGQRIRNHQSFAAVAKDGTLSGQFHEIDNKLSPGATVRHDCLKQSAIREDDSGLICLHFSLVGCVTLSVNRVSAVLLIPEVRNLLDFADWRQFLTPQTAQDCRIAGAADAALQAQVRLRARRAASRTDVPSCYAMTCRPTQWNKKQKPRVATVHVPAESDDILDRFERAWLLLPPRLVVPKPPGQTFKRLSRATTREPFWSDSVARPLIAENLALGRPWYAGFTRLMAKTNPADGRPYRVLLRHERKGLYDMIADPKMWNHDGEKLVVQSVHEAMRTRYGQIAEENRTNPVGMKNRMERFRERLRLSLSGAKREADVTFNANTPWSNLGAKDKDNPGPYGTELHATRYQYGIALTPERLRDKSRAAKAIAALCDLGNVAGNHGRFLFDFSPDSIVIRLTDDPAPRILYCFETDDAGKTVVARSLFTRIVGGDVDPQELIVGGSFAADPAVGDLRARGVAVFPNGVKLAAAEAVKRIDASLAVKE